MAEVISPAAFIHLFYLQAIAKNDKENTRAQIAFAKAHDSLLPAAGIERSTAIAPAIFAEQPVIPYVLLKPKSATAAKKSPLIVHVHGGPKVHIAEDIRNAELAYFLSHGYTVACVNYRGSTNTHPDPMMADHWAELVTSAEGKYHRYGPEDVCAVAMFMKAQDYIDDTNILLRGGSFGSYINSQLLAGIKAGKYPSIFKGVHLSGGLQYPVAATMPTDIPLLVTHGKQDDIAPCEDAVMFMRSLLLHRTIGTAANNVKTFVAAYGGHHLINPKILVAGAGFVGHQESLAELELFLRLMTNFFSELVTDTWQPEPCLTQLAGFTTKPEKLIASLRYVREFYPLPALGRLQDPTSAVTEEDFSPCGPTLKLLDLYADAPEIAWKECPEEGCGRSYRVDSSITFCPIHGDELQAAASGATTLATDADSIETKFRSFLQLHFAKITNLHGEPIDDAHIKILTDEHLVAQCIAMIKQEEVFLQANPDYMVLYHAAPQRILFLYTFIDFWRKMLANKPLEVFTVEAMRSSDCISDSFLDIQTLLKTIKTNPNGGFAEIHSYIERVLSANPSLVSNCHSASASSLHWYCNGFEDRRDYSDIEEIMADLFHAIGIHSDARITRYIELFKRLAVDGPAGVMQQLFIPYAQIKDKAYMSQLWGVRLKKQELETPSIMREFLQNPRAFEERLRKERDDIFKDLAGQGAISEKALFTKEAVLSSALQARLLLRTDLDITCKSSFRQEENYQEFLRELLLLIQEDYADYLVAGTLPSRDLMPVAASVKSCLLLGTEGRDLPVAVTAPSSKCLFRQQLALREGFVGNLPTCKHFADILQLPREEKEEMQMQLQTKLQEERLEKRVNASAGTLTFFHTLASPTDITRLWGQSTQLGEWCKLAKIKLPKHLHEQEAKEIAPAWMQEKSVIVCHTIDSLIAILIVVKGGKPVLSRIKLQASLFDKRTWQQLDYAFSFPTTQMVVKAHTLSCFTVKQKLELLQLTGLRMDLRSAQADTVEEVYPFSLCLHLQGYTYYDLIKEILTTCAPHITEDIMELFYWGDAMPLPKYGDIVFYSTLRDTLFTAMAEFKYDPSEHMFFSREVVSSGASEVPMPPPCVASDGIMGEAEPAMPVIFMFASSSAVPEFFDTEVKRALDMAFEYLFAAHKKMRSHELAPVRRMLMGPTF